MQSLGIASLIALTKALAGSATVVSNVMADKEVNYKDAVHIPAALGVIKDYTDVDFDQLIPEMNDLTGEEQDALAKEFRDAFNIENKDREATIEEGFQMLLQGFEAVKILISLGDKIKGLISGKYKPQSPAQGSQANQQASTNQGQASSPSQGQTPSPGQSPTQGQGQAPEGIFDDSPSQVPGTTDAGVPYTPPAEQPASSIPPESPATGNAAQSPSQGQSPVEAQSPSQGQSIPTESIPSQGIVSPAESQAATLNSQPPQAQKNTIDRSGSARRK